MTIWPPSREQLTRPVYRAIAQAMVDAVEAGEIREGARLTPHRTLAYQLGVSVHTVSRAYEELTRLGLIRGEVGRGSYVTSGPSEPPMPWQTIDGDGGIIDLSMLVPVLTSKHEETMRAAIADMRGEDAGAGDEDEKGRLEAGADTNAENGDR